MAQLFAHVCFGVYQLKLTLTVGQWSMLVLNLESSAEQSVKTNVLPAEASDQHAHDEGANQTSNSKDRHSERVHEGQGLPTESCSITTHCCLVVEVLYVLRGEGIVEIGCREGQKKIAAETLKTMMYE